MGDYQPTVREVRWALDYALRNLWKGEEGIVSVPIHKMQKWSIADRAEQVKFEPIRQVTFSFIKDEFGPLRDPCWRVMFDGIVVEWLPRKVEAPPLEPANKAT